MFLETIESQKLCKDDYIELAQLWSIFLRKKKKICMSIKKSGCVHKAHWMVKILYELKIVLFYDEISSLPKSFTTSRRLLELKDNAIFIAHVYCDWWLQCQSVKRAPSMDSTFYQTLMKYKSMNSKIASSAIFGTWLKK